MNGMNRKNCRCLRVTDKFSLLMKVVCHTFIYIKSNTVMLSSDPFVLIRFRIRGSIQLYYLSGSCSFFH
jgi:hypothetical protein